VAVGACWHAAGVDDDDFAFGAELWRWNDGSWIFVTVPPDVSTDLRMAAGPPRGFGSVRVEVTIGSSVWRTSVFPESSGSYALPIKKQIRMAEGIDEGDHCEVLLRLVDES
jgi:hypothetical protein